MPGLSGKAQAAKTELVPRFRLDAGDYITAGEVAPDGRCCVVGLGNGEVAAFDFETGRELFRKPAHDGGVLSVSISSDGERIATSGQDHEAKLWSATGELLRTMPGGSGWVEHVAWSPAGDRLATASGRQVRLWSREGETVLGFADLASTVTALAWRADGSGLAASCFGGVSIWAPGAKDRHLAWKGSLISMAWSPNGKVIACGSQDSSVHFWRLASGQDSEMTGYASKPKALAWDFESRLLATAGDATLTLWDFRGKGPEGSHPIQLPSHEGICTQLAFRPKTAVLASGSEDTSVLLWEPRRGNKPIRFGFLDDEVTVLAWHPQDRGLLAGDASGTLVVWEAG